MIGGGIRIDDQRDRARIPLEDSRDAFALLLCLGNMLAIRLPL